MLSFRPRLFMVFSFERTTSVLPAAASSRSMPVPTATQHHAAVGINQRGGQRAVGAQQ